MKKIYSLIAFVALMLCSSAYISANVLNINGVDQQVDTIIPKHQVGPGTTYAFYHCPNRPLTIHVLEVDLTNPYVQMEVCDGGQKSVATETPSSMYARNDAPGHDMVAVFNGDFFHTTSTDATATGMSRMGLISNGECILNPVGYPMFVLSDERIAYTELLYFNATLSTATSSTRIHTLNSHALEFDASDDSERMILYTNAYGTKTNNTSAGTSIVIAPKEGDKFNFADNCTISCIVESSVDNAASSTIPTGKAILYGTGTNATFLKTLAVGDECTINISNTMPAQAAVKNIKEALGGSGHFIIQNGEVVISGNPDIHPRTFMGISQDRTKVYSVVVDGRWAGSAGVTLDDEGRILKWLGAWNGINLDGGGSSGMVVNSEYKNHASDGTERAVGNGMLVFSSAPVDDNIAQIAFEARQYNVPITARFKPAIYGYNQYGVLKSKDLEGVKLSCDPQVGSFNDNNEFIAAETIQSGYIYAEYNGITTKQAVSTILSPLSLIYDKYIVDDRRGYPIQMNAQIGNFTYGVDAASVNWAISDESVCSINDGKVTGIKNGEAQLTGASTNFSGIVNIVVEIPEKDMISLFPAFTDTTWTLKQTGGKGITATQYKEGVKLNYTGNAVTRGAYISMEADSIKTYSLPYGLRLEINPGEAPITKISVIMENALGERATAILANSALTPNQTQSIFYQLNNDWDTDNNAIYPIKISRIRFDMGKSNKDTAYEIQLSKFEQLYGDPVGIESVSTDNVAAQIFPNPVSSGAPVNVIVDGPAVVYIYSLSGNLMQQATLHGAATIDTAMLPAGMYIVKIDSDGTTATAKLIVK